MTVVVKPKPLTVNKAFLLFPSGTGLSTSQSTRWDLSPWLSWSGGVVPATLESSATMDPRPRPTPWYHLSGVLVCPIVRGWRASLMGRDLPWTRGPEEASWSQANLFLVGLTTDQYQQDICLLEVEHQTMVRTDWFIVKLKGLNSHNCYLCAMLVHLCAYLSQHVQNLKLSRSKNKSSFLLFFISGNKGNRFGISGVTGERLDRMEEDLRHLTQGLDTLNGVVAGLEERLRTSLREDTNKILGSLLPSGHRLPDSGVGFGVIPIGTPDGEGEGFPGVGDLAGRVTEVSDELRAKAHILEEIQVLWHCDEAKLKWMCLSSLIEPGLSLLSPSLIKCFFPSGLGL